MNQILQRHSRELPSSHRKTRASLRALLLDVLKSERQWAELFSRPESEELLERLADEALTAHQAG